MLLLFYNSIVGRVLELYFLVSQNKHEDWNFVYDCKLVFKCVVFSNPTVRYMTQVFIRETSTSFTVLGMF